MKRTRTTQSSANTLRLAPAAAAARQLFPVIAVCFSVCSAGFSSQALAADAASAPTSAPASNVLPTVSVQATGATLPGDLSAAYPGGQVASGAQIGVLGQQKLIDVPFSVTSYTSKLIEDQQARTLADVVANDPAVRTALGYGNFSETYIIRGFEVYSDDVALNGMYGLTPRQMVDTGAIERVDIFKGANAFVNGASPGGSGVGGSINVQTKVADDKPLTQLTVAGSASGELATHVDVGRRFGENDQYGIRVNQTVQGGDSSIDDEARHAQQTAVSLDYRGDKLRLYADFLYQKERITEGRPGVFVSGDALPSAPSATHNYTQPWTWSSLEDTVGMLRGEYDIAPDWTVYAGVGTRHTHENGDYLTATYGINGATSAYRLGSAHDEYSLSAQAGVRGKFVTGAVSHAISAGWQINRVAAYNAFDFSPSFPTSLYNTQPVARPDGFFSGGDFADPGLTAVTLMRGFAVSDTMGFFGDRFLFTVGVRQQNLIQNGYDYGTEVQNAAYNASATTPVFGAVYKLQPNLSVYANRSESLLSGGTAPGNAVNVGAVIAPFRATQYEAGVKYDANHYGAALALYQIRQQVAYTDSVTGIYGANGIQRHRGVEFSMYGEPLNGVRLIGGVSYINAKLEDTNYGAENGNRPIGVPAWTFNANVEYDVPHASGLTLMARALWTSTQYLDQANTLQVPSWTRFDIGARYKTRVFNRDTSVNMIVTNLANRSYWSSALGGYLTQGAPRTAWFSVTTEF
ncbi:TonB-dependent receptor [Paraburkholderia dinghuensis]|uniref:TonB-dependent siderophore receptor n=1 Tax=Paraburkholderia dinghuensis TaxID=2305225 RepID=A0A3N6NKW3_9BURK|nr:TonB-dependent siderophore receptor [Paraburkholderia dinghuensis]RQH09822.1 TonB-dependent siderophore receptor [Paraburkholderia dinghuensis]